MKKTEVLNLDGAGISILALSKNDLTESARQLQSKYDKLTQYEMLSKLQFLIETYLEMIKEDTKKTFLEKFGGSKSERENGFLISLCEMQEYKYSDKVLNLESEIKLMKEQLKQMKAKEVKSKEALTGKVKSDFLKFTLK